MYVSSRGPMAIRVPEPLRVRPKAGEWYCFSTTRMMDGSGCRVPAGDDHTQGIFGQFDPHVRGNAPPDPFGGYKHR